MGGFLVLFLFFQHLIFYLFTYLFIYLFTYLFVFIGVRNHKHEQLHFHIGNQGIIADSV